jgi:starch synthase
MRYGTLPVVRATGGLADTVMNYDDGAADEGTGFVFDMYAVDALLETLRWVRSVYFDRPDSWQRMQARAMQLDFSWDASAREYERRYRQVIARRVAQLSAVST